MRLPQNHDAGGPGGSGYPSFEIKRRFMRTRASKGKMTTTAMAVVASARLVFSISMACGKMVLVTSDNGGHLKSGSKLGPTPASTLRLRPLHLRPRHSCGGANLGSSLSDDGTTCPRLIVQAPYRSSFKNRDFCGGTERAENLTGSFAISSTDGTVVV